MKNVINKTSIAFKQGNRFRFPDDETVYEFWYIEYLKGEPVVRYYDEIGNSLARVGFDLMDLIRC